MKVCEVVSNVIILLYCGSECKRWCDSVCEWYYNYIDYEGTCERTFTNVGEQSVLNRWESKAEGDCELIEVDCETLMLCGCKRFQACERESGW